MSKKPNSFVRFFGESGAPKSAFEINWPLASGSHDQWNQNLLLILLLTLQYKQFVLKVLFQIGVIVINESIHYVYAFELQLAVNIQSIQYFCSYLYVAKSVKPIEFRDSTLVNIL